MTCTCILCKRKVKACNKPIQVHWTPRNAAENIQRQRHQLRRRRSQASRAEGCFRGPTTGSTEIRNGRRIHLRLYTTQGTALRRVMGDGSEVRQTPSRARNRQRAAHRRRTTDAARRGRGRTQLATPGTTESGPERWRGPNTSAPTSWVPSSSAATSPSIDGPNALLRQMATCLLSQATVLATVVQELPVGSATTWHPKRNLELNDLVLVQEDNTPPQQWVLGRVAAIVTGQDGKVRVADVATKAGVIKRPVHKLAVLPSDVEGP
ncbi:uncharacterized protein LOC128869540 [Anastrepha ludens]|uniref:uncharacterized protein LOC128869540 n=1 Tax=Anastrepha ludens TaxID=28586 RepID=UPI0023AE7CFA|nr:uncharacterized protein LOC128869540 [Anastrepha ludens]